MMYELPTSVTVGGTEYEIRSDYRAVLDILTALYDPDLTGQDKTIALLDIFYPGLSEMPPEHYGEAVDMCLWFMNCGQEEDGRKTPRLMDWEQDFQYLIAPINRVVGQEIRSIPYDRAENTGGFHWWSFMSAYFEIGDCFFAQLVRIRSMKAKGKRLDKPDQEFYRQNRKLVDLKVSFSSAEDDFLREWMNG